MSKFMLGNLFGMCLALMSIDLIGVDNLQQHWIDSRVSGPIETVIASWALVVYWKKRNKEDGE